MKQSMRIITLIFCCCLSASCASVAQPVSGDKARDASRYNAELGAKYLQRNDLGQARTKLEKALQQDKKNALAHVTYARLLQRIGDEKKAGTHFRRAISLQPDEAEHHNAYGAYLCEQENYAGAEKEFLSAAKNPYYKTPEYALDNAGLCLMDNEDLAGAEKYLRDALRSNPRFASALYHMAQLTFRQRRLTVSEAYLARHHEYARESSRSLLLALNLKREMGDSNGAQSYANKLLSDFPGSQEAGEYLARPL